MSVRSGQSVTTEFTTRAFATGAATDAIGTPTGTLYVNGTANGATVTVTNQATGLYKAAVTLPTLAVGDVVSIIINATVSGVTDNAKIWEDSKDVFAGAIPDVAAGASGGLLISGSNSGTTTLEAFTVSGATTLSGAVSLGSTLGVTGTTTFAAINTGAIGTSGTVTFNAFTVTNATTLTGIVTASNASNNIVGIDVTKLGGSTTPITNMTTVFSTDFATNYNTTNDGWVVKLGNYAQGGAGTQLQLEWLQIDDSLTTGGVCNFDSLAVTTTSTFTGAVSLGSTLGVAGTTTFAAINTGAIGTSGTVTFNAFTVTNAMTVSGATTLTGAVTATNASNDIRGILISPTSVTDIWDAGNIDGYTYAGALGEIYYNSGKEFIAVGTIGNAGNTTTALNLTGLTYGDDTLNNLLLVITDVSTGDKYARWITDWSSTGDIATVATLPFTPQDNVDTYTILAIRGDVESVTGNVGGSVTGSVGSVTGDIGGLAAGAITDVENAVWDATLASHLSAGSTGFALNAAGSAGDPWGTALPGAYGAGTAGNILGNNLDAAVSTRSTLTQAQVTGGAYALNSASFSFNSALDFTTTQKAATLARVTLVDTLSTYTNNTPQTGDSFARIGATGSGLTSLAPSATALSTAQWTNTLATNLGTLASHDPGTTIGTSTLTQAQVTGGAYALNSASFAFNSGLDFTTTQKASIVSSAVASVTGNVGGNVAGSVGSVTGDIGGLSSGAITDVEDAVWDAVLANHLDAGSTGFALNAAGSAGDPWSTALPGAYSAGSAGFIVGTNLDALITSRMASYAQPTGFLAATFPSTVASPTNITAGTITTVSGNVTGSVGSVTGTVGGIAGTTQTLDALQTAQNTAHGAGSWATATGFATSAQGTAIQAKTDQLTFTVAGQLDTNIQYVNDVQVTGVGTAGNPWGPV